MFYPDFSSLGLSDTEGKVYLALLELGGGLVSTIARRAKLPRVNCYHTLENLAKKGLVSHVTKDKDKARIYSAEPPQVLCNALEEKAEYAKKILPELLSLTNAHTIKPRIKYFEGRDGIKNIFDDMLTSTSELLGYSNLKRLGDVYHKQALEFMAKKTRIGLKSRLISPSSEEGFRFFEEYYPKNASIELMEVLFVNSREFWFEHDIHIYGNKVAVISLNPEEIIGMIFESPVYAKSQRAIFHMAWLGASSFIAQ